MRQTSLLGRGKNNYVLTKTAFGVSKATGTVVCRVMMIGCHLIQVIADVVLTRYDA